MSRSVRVLRSIALAAATIGAGGAAGALIGFGYGLWMGRDYQRLGPADPGDAPAYVAIGLAMIGACIGVLTVGVAAAILTVRRLRRRSATGAA